MSHARMALRAVVGLGTAGLLVSLLVPLWFVGAGQRLLVVSSQSMAPTLAVGDVAVLEQLPSVSDLHPGLLVTFRPPGGGELVTHRLVSAHVLPRTATDPSTGRVHEVLDAFGRPELGSWLVTKGDANAEQDPDAVPVTSVRGVVVGVGHGWGPALTALTSSAVRAALAVPALLSLGAIEVLDRRAAGRLGRRP